MDKEDSILLTAKSMIGGIPPEYKNFDSVLITFINSAISILSDLGIEEAESFYVSSEDDKWSDFIQDQKLLSFVKPFISQKVQLYFDPPQSSILLESLKAMISENEWRIANYKVNHSGGANDGQ